MQKLAKMSQFNKAGTVHYKVQHGENGETSVALAVDYERAPVPDHSYVADFFQVSRSGEDVLIIFGKIDYPAGDKLRNKLEIYFPYTPFVYQLWRSSKRVRANLVESFSKRGASAPSFGELSSQTDKVQTLVTNNALVVLSTGQVLLDFFLISGKDMWVKTRKGDPLNMEAVVRVFTSEAILLGFLNACDEIAQLFINEFGIVFLEDEDEIVESI